MFWKRNQQSVFSFIRKLFIEKIILFLQLTTAVFLFNEIAKSNNEEIGHEIIGTGICRKVSMKI